MHATTLPRTALRGRSRSAHDALAKGLGWFSIGLGTLELVAARSLADGLGLHGRDGLVRAYGVREVVTGIAILASHDPEPWIWARVMGDALDLATLAVGAGRAEGSERTNVAVALAAVAGVTALDILCAQGLDAEKGGPKTAVADYRDRSGFPKGVAAARGGARDFAVPRDMRVPDAMRGDVFARRRRPVPAGA